MYVEWQLQRQVKKKKFFGLITQTSWHTFITTTEDCPTWMIENMALFQKEIPDTKFRIIFD